MQLRNPFATPQILNIDGNFVGSGLSTKIAPISMSTSMEVFARLYKIRLKVKKTGKKSSWDVWLPLKKVFLETEGDQMVLYGFDGQTVVTVHRDMWVMLTINGTTQHNFTASYIRENRKAGRPPVPELDGEIFCEEAGCAEGCPENQFLTRTGFQGDLSCRPCVEGASLEPRGLFPGMCFCHDKLRIWHHSPPNATIPTFEDFTSADFPMKYVEPPDFSQKCMTVMEWKQLSSKKSSSTSTKPKTGSTSKHKKSKMSGR